jgi:isoleucyl-tRNA synthetase
LNALQDELRFLLITSAAQLQAREGLSGSELTIEVRPLDAAKCIRCWHRRPDVGSSTEHPEICSRCVTNLGEPGEKRAYA